MEQSLKLRILESIGKVYDQSKESKLDDAFFKKVDTELKHLSDYFKVSQNQSLFVAMIFALNYKGDSVDLKNLQEYFDCNPMRLLEFSDDFEELKSKGILKREKPSFGVKLALSNYLFTVNEKITKAILSSEPMPVMEHEDSEDAIEILEELFNISQQRSDEQINTSTLLIHTQRIMDSNVDFPLINTLNNLHLTIEDKCLFIYLIWKTLTGNESSNLEMAADDIYDNSAKKIRYIQRIISNKNLITSKNHIKIIESNFVRDAHMELSDSSIKMLEKFGLKIFANKKKQDSIIVPDKINSKTLYFNDFERKQLDLLQNLLQEDKFKEMQIRLKDKGLPIGITALLHGSPGTGKTETVFQVAKKNLREIVKVDISHTKSMWFGESEKIIKRVFTDYKSYAKDCERMPILLFNEADAIISKRQEIGTSAVTQIENTIQNIILEELENFEGIFFATTNLVKNMDLAFERRFLFKIEFQKPDVSVKAKIWNLKLPSLSETECEILAKGFDFSGGQIDNIVRKNEIHEIINGISVSFNNIVEFCKTEFLLQDNGVKIGFKKSCQKENQYQDAP